MAGLAAHCCLTIALSFAQATIVVPIEFLRLPVVALGGATIDGERPHIALIVGATPILAAIALSLPKIRGKSVADAAN